MTRRRQIFFALVLVLPNLILAQSKVAIYGSIWENGNESTCNWYFKGDIACMQLIFKGQESETIETKLIMNAQTNILSIVTSKNGINSCYVVPADSILKLNNSQVTFKTTGSTKEFDGFGNCVRYNAKSHTNEYLTFTFENQAISLQKFKSFIKNDPVFEYFSSYSNHLFPAQAITVSPTGELQRSYLASGLELDFSEAIFQVTCD